MTIPFVLDLISTIGDAWPEYWIASIWASVKFQRRSFSRAACTRAGCCIRTASSNSCWAVKEFRRIKSSKCLPGTYGLAGELDVKPFNTSADISCLRLQTTFVRNNLTVQPDLLHGVTATDTGSLNIGESHGLIREPDGIGIGNSITLQK